MEVIVKHIEYNHRSDKFPLYPIGDSHLGIIHCDEDFLRATVAEIKANKNALWLGMGDYGDCITPSDFKRWEGKALAPWMKDNVDNIGPTQVEKVDEIFSPIWGQCLGLIEGNHDDNIRRYTHYDFMRELLKRANRKHKVPYAGVSCIVRLSFKRLGSETMDYLVHARHGEGSARTSGARALAVLRLVPVFTQAHITLMGHLHGQESPDIPQRLTLNRRDQIKSFETIATMTGSWLRAYMQGVPPIYLERWGSPPSVLGCPRIILEPDKRKMTLEKSRMIRLL